MKRGYEVIPFLAILLLAFVTVFPATVKEARAEEPPTNELISMRPPSHLWNKMKQYFLWDLEWFDSADWISKKSLLGVIWDYPNETAAKFTLNFTSESAGSYRLSIAVDMKVKSYVNRTNMFHYNLTFEGYSLIFDWSDLKDIPGLTFKHGVKNGYFWFRIKHDNVPANKNVLLDPTFVVIFAGDTPWGSRYSNQIKTFRNPRGLRWYYAMSYDWGGASDRDLEVWKSEYGTSSWSLESEIASWGLGAPQYDSSSLWIDDNGTDLIVYFVWAESAYGDIGIHYRRGVIDDSDSTIALETAQKLVDGWFIMPVITLAEDGYLWITAQHISGGLEVHDVDGYNEIVCDWTKQGSSPYLHGGLTNYVYTSSKNDEVYEFTFADNLSNPSSCTLAVKGAGDGGDYVECYLYDGSSWSSNYDITPPVVAAFETIDVSDFLDTDAKIDAAKLWLIKQNKGSSNTLYVYEAELRVQSGWSHNLTVMASNVAYKPSVSDWSSVKAIYNTTGAEGHIVKPTIAPCSATRDIVIGFRHNDGGYQNLSMVEGDWDGSSFTFQTVENITTPVMSEQQSDSVRVAVDSNNIVHVGFINYTVPAYVNYTVGSGFGTYHNVSTMNSRSASMSIDMTYPDERICIVYTADDVGDSYDTFYKTQTIGSINFTYATEGRIVEPYAGVGRLSASYRDVDGKIQFIGTRSYGGHVLWAEIPCSYYVDFYFMDGGTLRVNKTITANETRTYYIPNEVINITAIPSYSYAFDNFTYDGSDTTNNPFYLTITENFGVIAYFYFSFDCNYIGINSTIAGEPILFSANWTDLNVAEGLDYFQCLTNNSGPWVAGSWSNSWRSTVWADAEYTLNDTEDTTVAFRFQANDTSGTLYNSTICFFTVQSTGGNTSAWFLAACAVGALIFIPSMATIILIRGRKR